MTEVAYGNPETMSATQDISSQERLDDFVSPGLPTCSNASFSGAVQNPVENAMDPNEDLEGGPSGKVIQESKVLSGEATAGNDEVTLSAENLKVSIGAEDFNMALGSPHQYSLDTKDSSIEDRAFDASKAELVEILPAVEISAVKISALGGTSVETSALETSPVDTSALGKLFEDAPVVMPSNMDAHAVDLSTVETRGMEFPVTADLKEETALGGECSQFQDLVQDVVPVLIRMDGEFEDGILKDKSTDENVGVEEESLPSHFKNGGQEVTSISSTVDEPPLIGFIDAGQKPLDENEVVQNGESGMHEEVPARNHTVSLSTIGVTRFENEINIARNDITGRTVDEAAQMLTEDIGDKLVDEMADRKANKLADGMADRMADAIADEIADQIADRMADEIADKMADEMADCIADAMADRMADEMADRMADEMADRMADEMAAEVADELADELAEEVIEGDFESCEGLQENARLDDEETYEVGGMGEEVMADDANNVMDDDDYEDDEGSPAEQMSFVEELERFFKQRNLEYKAPKFYGLELNVLKLWRVVSRYGGYDHVTVSKLWRTVGEEFKPPKTCTTISWSFRGFFEKALLDYERFKTGVSAPDSSQRAVQTIGYYLSNDQRTASPATPSSDPNIGGTPGSGSGRARRDAAARAMQGWHSQRMSNGDAKEPSSKDKGSGGKHVKKEKKLTNIGGNGLKRKGSKTVLERAVKAVQARGRPKLHEESPPSNSAVTGKRSMKQQDPGRRPMKVPKMDGPVGGFDPPIVDEGPKADWVKINVHKHLDCFEIYALVPGLAREEVRIQCEPGGRLVIAGMPEDPENPWGVTPFRKVICLPSRIDAHQTSAVVTLYGQLYVRVPIAEDKSS